MANQHEQVTEYMHQRELLGYGAKPELRPDLRRERRLLYPQLGPWPVNVYKDIAMQDFTTKEEGIAKIRSTYDPGVAVAIANRFNLSEGEGAEIVAGAFGRRAQGLRFDARGQGDEEALETIRKAEKMETIAERMKRHELHLRE